MKYAIPLAALLAGSAVHAAPEPGPAFGEGMVLQRGQPVIIEGSAAPGSAVTGTLGTEAQSAGADANGSFRLTFAAREASAEPLTLRLADATGETVISDIVVGDVWLCSGQSNMVFTVAAGLNGNNNIQASTDPLLRMLNVPLDTAAKPVREFGGEVQWQAASPATTGSFSAACYYMLRDLRAATGVPQGAINASWGGSQIRAWLTPEAGAVLYGAQQMALLGGFAEDPLAAIAEFAPVWEAWWREATGEEPWKEPGVLDWRPVPRIGPWTAWGEGAPPPIGNVWFRYRLDLTNEQIARGGTLNIGIIDDLDATWVNGNPVGITHGWSTERRYRVPAEFLHEGTNEIIFAASNSWAGGGMQSSADRLSFTPEGGPAISLAEGWRYAAGEVREMPPRTPWDANAGIGVMHNRMIAPIGPYRLAGAVWYQGESDVGIPGYQDRLRELFAGWRRQFGEQARMLVVQLPDYGARASEPAHSGWATLREDQRQAALADRDAALVTAIDLGEPTDIHPTNKVVLGQRLALAAIGEALPNPVRARRGDGEVVVEFSGVEGGLRTYSGPFALSVELCAEAEDSCIWVLASADGDSLRIPAHNLVATRVRYAWADAPIVNLYDARDIPVPGFEMAIE